MQWGYAITAEWLILPLTSQFPRENVKAIENYFFQALPWITFENWDHLSQYNLIYYHKTSRLFDSCGNAVYLITWSSCSVGSVVSKLKIWQQTRFLSHNVHWLAYFSRMNVVKYLHNDGL